MSPFPWHFGGQRYQNIFMDPDEIINFCKKAKDHPINVTIDIGCNYNEKKINFYLWSL